MQIAQQSQLINYIPDFIKTNISLRDKNWFKTGGPARFYCEPETAEQFQQALQFAQEHKLAIFMLGEGANILVSDEGFDGLVIQPKIQNIQLVTISGKITSAHPEHNSETEACSSPATSFDEFRMSGSSNAKHHALVEAGSGVSFQALINWCLDNNLTGIEEFSGIPGTVGGSVYINIHYFEFLLSQFLVSAHVIHAQTGTISQVSRDWFNFGYNQSRLQEKEYYILSATFKLKQATDLEAAYAKGRRDEIIRHRQQRYPRSHTCGSFFRNFLEHEVTLESAGKKLIYVAYYLDKIGVKGQLSVGDAIVSYQHANMLVNRGNATSQDLITLARTMQQLVLDQFGIVPKTECILVGFKQSPLL